jgi:hypothetical protein
MGFMWKNDFDKQMEKRWSAPYRDISFNRMWGSHTRYITVLNYSVGVSSFFNGLFRGESLEFTLDGRLDEWLKSESC